MHVCVCYCLISMAYLLWRTEFSSLYRKEGGWHLKNYSNSQMPFPCLSCRMKALQQLSPIKGGLYSLPGPAYLDKGALFQTRPVWSFLLGTWEEQCLLSQGVAGWSVSPHNTHTHIHTARAYIWDIIKCTFHTVQHLDWKIIPSSLRRLHLSQSVEVERNRDLQTLVLMCGYGHVADSCYGIAHTTWL